ncbi:MAG: response regulator [Nitrospira sp.]|nr:response regulator [Nitrospira sp.]
MPSPIFVVDSSPAVRRLVEQLSAPEGLEVIGFQDGPAALEAARQMNPLMIIADYQLSNITFSGFCKEIHKLEHLSETSLIALVNPADRPDEKLLRTLGVKAFLNKPIQSDDLLMNIKSVQQHQAVGNGKGLKRRSWPPTSTGSDEDDDAPNPILSSTETDESAEDRTSSPPVRIVPTASISPTDTVDSQRKGTGQFASTLPKGVQTKPAHPQDSNVDDVKLSINIQPIVQKEVRAQLGEILSEEYLVSIIRPLLSQTLPSLLEKELKSFEPMIKQSVSDLVGPVLNTTLDQRLPEQAEASIRKYLPTVIHEQIGSIDQLVKDEIQAAVLKQAPQLANDLIRTVVETTVEQAVQQLVPGLAEQQIKAELTRLTSDP